MTSRKAARRQLGCRAKKPTMGASGNKAWFDRFSKRYTHAEPTT